MTAKAKFRFECVNESDYKMTIIYETSSNMFKNMFLKAQKKLSDKEGLNVEGNIDIIESFEIPEQHKAQMLPILKHATRKQVKQVAKEVGEDGVVLLNNEVKNAIYKRVDNDLWEIEVIVVGQYVIKEK